MGARAFHEGLAQEPGTPAGGIKLSHLNKIRVKELQMRGGLGVVAAILDRVEVGSVVVAARMPFHAFPLVKTQNSMDLAPQAPRQLTLPVALGRIARQALPYCQVRAIYA